MIIRTVTQECPVCGYIFKKQSKVETRTIPPSRLITCKPGYGPVRHDYPTEREFVVNSKILAGDVEFIRISKHLISCPLLFCYCGPFRPRERSEHQSGRPSKL